MSYLANEIAGMMDNGKEVEQWNSGIEDRQLITCRQAGRLTTDNPHNNHNNHNHHNYLPPLLRFSPNNSILVEIKPYRYDILYR